MKKHSSLFSLTLDSSHLQSLEQLSDKDYLEYARSLATDNSDREQAQAEEYLECRLSSGHCLMPLTAIYEVVPSPDRFTPFPASPPWMLGVVAWRGETVAVVDVAAYLADGASERAEGGFLLMGYTGDLVLALWVEGIGEAGMMQNEAALLDMPRLLVDIAQQIETTASHA